jgi:predicted nucleotidyltransferase
MMLSLICGKLSIGVGVKREERNKWLSMQVAVVKSLVYLVNHGSHAYGLARPESDIDVKGILIAPTEIFTGYTTGFEQSINSEELKSYLRIGEVDSVVYGLQKFFKLAADCNPNIIEMLFVGEDDTLLSTSAGEEIRSNRDLFVSLKAKHTFSGYAHAQLKRINTHRRWLLDPPKGCPQRADFGLPEVKLISGDALGTVKTLEDSGHSFSTELMEAIKKEKAYAAAFAHWKQYENWKKTRNPKRAMLEAKYGYDCKHAMHLVRLMRMCVEILSGRGVIVRRKHDAEELNAIRDGAWSYDRLMTEANTLESKAEELYELNPAGLPRGANHKALNALCVRLQRMYGN